MSKELVDIKNVSYEVGGNKVDLSPAVIKKYLVSGGGDVSDQEVMLFMQMCKGQGLNPFLREAYLVKYKSSNPKYDNPATMIVGKEAFMKRAESDNDFNGYAAGIIVVNMKGEIEERKGSFYISKGNREELVGGWAKVFYKSGKEPVYHTVSIDEYIGKKSNGEITAMWATKKATMIRKVALVQALREAFPQNLGNMFTADEMQINENDLDVKAIDPEEKIMEEQHVPKTPVKASAAVKSQIMSMAKIKGLVTGEGKDADLSGLESLCNENGMSLRALTQDQAEKLIQIINEYEEIQEAEFEEVLENE